MQSESHSTAASRYLIVNADDFGLSSGVNRGIIEAHERGILTSASLMVRYPGAAEAADLARTHSKLSIGLHFDAAEWRYRDGKWEAIYRVVDDRDAGAVRSELDRQLATFTHLVGRSPTHLDSHQHMHLREPARSILSAAARELGIPLRSCSEAIAYCGKFYGQTSDGERNAEGISIDYLVALIQTLPKGWTEFGTHPGYEAGLRSVYAREREEELRVLCSGEVRAAVNAAHLQLSSFHDLRL